MKQPEELRLPALEIRQGDRRLYQFALDGKRLHELSTVSRIRRSDEGEIAEIELPAASEPHGLAIGPDGALWVALEAGALLRFTPQ